jgi:hypothetical protein
VQAVFEWPRRNGNSARCSISLRALKAAHGQLLDLLAPELQEGEQEGGDAGAEVLVSNEGHMHRLLEVSCSALLLLCCCASAASAAAAALLASAAPLAGGPLPASGAPCPPRQPPLTPLQAALRESSGQHSPGRVPAGARAAGHLVLVITLTQPEPGSHFRPRNQSSCLVLVELQGQPAEMGDEAAAELAAALGDDLQVLGQLEQPAGQAPSAAVQQLRMLLGLCCRTCCSDAGAISHSRSQAGVDAAATMCKLAGVVCASAGVGCGCVLAVAHVSRDPERQQGALAALQAASQAQRAQLLVQQRQERRSSAELAAAEAAAEAAAAEAAAAEAEAAEAEAAEAEAAEAAAAQPPRQQQGRGPSTSSIRLSSILPSHGHSHGHGSRIPSSSGAPPQPAAERSEGQLQQQQQQQQQQQTSPHRRSAVEGGSRLPIHAQGAASDRRSELGDGAAAASAPGPAAAAAEEQERPCLGRTSAPPPQHNQQQQQQQQQQQHLQQAAPEAKQRGSRIPRVTAETLPPAPAHEAEAEASASSGGPHHGSSGSSSSPGTEPIHVPGLTIRSSADAGSARRPSQDLSVARRPSGGALAAGTSGTKQPGSPRAAPSARKVAAAGGGPGSPRVASPRAPGAAAARPAPAAPRAGSKLPASGAAGSASAAAKASPSGTPGLLIKRRDSGKEAGFGSPRGGSPSLAGEAASGEAAGGRAACPALRLPLCCLGAPQQLRSRALALVAAAA